MNVTALSGWFAVAALAATALAPDLARSEPNCTCRYKGQSYALDSCVCLSTRDGPRMACCGLVLNNTSWNFTNKRCPVVERAPADRRQSLAVRREERRTR